MVVVSESVFGQYFRVDERFAPTLEMISSITNKIARQGRHYRLVKLEPQSP